MNPQISTVNQFGNAVFTCEAKAFPPPVVTWQPNGVTLTDTQPDILVTSETNTESMTTSSHLRVLFADVETTGLVTCIASTTPPQRSGVILDRDSRTTSLTILVKQYKDHVRYCIINSFCSIQEGLKSLMF